jgi:hypothetical protein
MARKALRIQDKISKGWSRESKALGQLWNLERYAPTKAVPDVVSPGISARVKLWEKTTDIEVDKVSYTYRVRTDRKPLQVNDMIVGIESASRRQMANLKERYTIISMRLMHDNIAVRTDRKIRIFRPVHRDEFNDASPTYSEGTPNISRDILVRRILDNVYLWIDPDTVANENYTLAGYDPDVWAGITFGRAGAYAPFIGHFQDVPLDSPNTGWVVTFRYFSDSIILRENDVIVDQADPYDWYRVDRPYYQNNSAFVNQPRCTRVRV